RREYEPDLCRAMLAAELVHRYCWKLPDNCFCGTPYIDRIMYNAVVGKYTKEICDFHFGLSEEKPESEYEETQDTDPHTGDDHAV
ncbi:MAG: hypothetical protein PHQ23_10365, partial [Candidatus Wallbacteria bacterium]|nr:hypothetical protein [Candidatus Wallbacteria bacterium]